MHMAAASRCYPSVGKMVAGVVVREWEGEVQDTEQGSQKMF